MYKIGRYKVLLLKDPAEISTKYHLSHKNLYKVVNLMEYFMDVILFYVFHDTSAYPQKVHI